MQVHEKACSVSAMCRVLDVTRSGYDAWKQRGERPRDAAFRRLFDRHKARYGAPRLPLELWEEGWTVSRKWVTQRMRELGLRAGAARKCMARLRREGMPSWGAIRLRRTPYGMSARAIFE